MAFLNQGNKVVKSFTLALVFVFLLYLVSIGLAVFYLPAGYAASTDVQMSIFGFMWYWTFKGVEIIWYWGMVLIIVFVGGSIDLFLKVVIEPVFQVLIDPHFYYSGASFQNTLTLIRSTVINILEPIQQLGENMQIVSVQGLRDLLGE